MENRWEISQVIFDDGIVGVKWMIEKYLGIGFECIRYGGREDSIKNDI